MIREKVLIDFLKNQFWHDFFGVNEVVFIRNMHSDLL